MKRVSSYIVAIPAYNEESSILATLESVLEASKHTSCTLRKIVICVNGCTDNTEQVVRNWKKGPVTVIKSKHGLINAMNRLNSYSRNYYPEDAFINVDADCLLDPHAIKYLIDQLNKHPDLALSGAHPYPVMCNNLSLYRRFVCKVLSVRGRVPMSEVAVREVKKYHPYAETDPLPGIGKREELLKIYFHGRMWCLRRSNMLPIFPSEIVAEDVFMPAWLFNNYGYGSIRLDYRALVYFKPNYSFRRHWKVYRRVHEDRARVYTMTGYEEYAKNCPLRLDWNYIFNQAPKRELVYFVLYTLIAKLEKTSFSMTRYRDEFWQYQEKEL
jgi:glycosyltransferase involved in cell wall biosynthesis